MASASSASKPRVGVVGLGIMGGAYARNLLSSGYSVVGTDVAEGALAAFATAGGRAVANLNELASLAEVVLLALPSEKALAPVAEGLASALRRDAIVCEMSTLSLEAKEAARATLAGAGAMLLDCPVSGTGAQAARKDIVIYASGDRAACERVKPVFDAVARETRYVGAFGGGTKLKFVANLLVTINNLATAEAMNLARQAGLDLGFVRQAISAGAGQSRIFDLRSPMMVEESFRPPSMKMDVFMKDVRLILDFAREVGAAAPLTTASLRWYEAALEQGHGEEDTAALYSVLKHAKVADSGTRD